MTYNLKILYMFEKFDIGFNNNNLKLNVGESCIFVKE